MYHLRYLSRFYVGLVRTDLALDFCHTVSWDGFIYILCKNLMRDFDIEKYESK